MEFGRWYVVEVSFRPTNPVHRAIAFEARSDGVYVQGGGYRAEWVQPEQLSFFRVVEEIAAMKERPSQFMPGEPT